MFKNEPLTDFTIKENRESFKGALEAFTKEVIATPLESKPIIGGKDIGKDSWHESFDPSDPDFRLGKVAHAELEDVNLAYQSLIKGRTEWKNSQADYRIGIIRKTAEIMRSEKLRLSALIIRETGKPWKEADADVAEAIDFCDYYAADMQRLSAGFKTSDLPGEENYYAYRPRGIAAVIAPWNFPLAIACGMTVAALVCGNSVILKPAEQSSLIAYELARILLRAGLPPNVLAFLPGRGEVVGRAIVSHAQTAIICFTGSKAVGLEILKNASVLQPGQTHIKKVITELGGKNCIIVDEDADLDEAIKGVLYSAFGYAGQKCSACSRLVVIGGNYEQLLSRLSEATLDLTVGAASDPASYFGPVIDKESQQRIISTISRGKENSKILAQTKVPEKGYFVPGTIFRDVPRDSALWNEEIFGPVLACCQASDFEEALRIANDSQYALTAGLYSRSPKNIQLAATRLEAGNIYINRPCTGALVGRQPFGGFKLSGIGSKAGGPDYLLQFLEPVCVSENTMRRGFAPVG